MATKIKDKIVGFEVVQDKVDTDNAQAHGTQAHGTQAHGLRHLKPRHLEQGAIPMLCKCMNGSNARKCCWVRPIR
ncbi:MAG: hypothetical protein IH909_07045 [Proteobacteria bacterium]|nr:hypothetical protein [Pseudomonadota bacterium]